MALPSEIRFVSFLQYAPQGTSKTSILSQGVCHAVKTDTFTPTRGGPFWVIKESASRIAERFGEFPFLARCFGPDVTLVPIPRSSPLVEPNALWPALRICQELKANNLARDIAPVLERATAVRKAATAGRKRRPTPPEHFQSTQVTRQLPLSPQRITLVDDVTTTGGTFIGMVPRLREAFPSTQIECFALIRTMSDTEVDVILDPVDGLITVKGAWVHREP
ncbi:MAG: hypothetical protein JNN07_23165 [Verrucomicrobiales bacterium]|nr:hypothetical protein [Verrucomicrobiales bacterium]